MEDKKRGKIVKFPSRGNWESDAYSTERLLHRPLPRNADYDALEKMRQRLISFLDFVTRELIFEEETEMLNDLITQTTIRLREVCARLSVEYQKELERGPDN